jgi:hypothetical protein
MRLLLCVGSFFFLQNTLANDCSSIAPFHPSGQQTVRVTVVRMAWDKGTPTDEEVCSKSTTIRWFDVRGREEEAYYCLKPNAEEIIFCETSLASEPAEIAVIPASWIRTWQPQPVREYRFHAYILKKRDPQFYYDVFSRALVQSLSSQDLVVEGALRTGPSNPDDGFWVRLEFFN